MPRVLDDVLHRVSKIIRESPDDMRTQLKISEETELLPIKVSIDSVDEDTSEVEVTSYVGKGYYFFALKNLLTKTVEAMYKHKWHVIHSSNEISFPTSDDPVICLNYNSEQEYNFRGGWDKKNGNIIMPITHWSRFFRKIIIEHAHRYVYAIKP